MSSNITPIKMQNTKTQDSGTSSQKGKITCYCTGGTGASIAQTIAEAGKRYDMQGVGEISVVIIDTSESNLLRGTKPENVYLLKGIDGSGKRRVENHIAITQASLDILEKHQPGDLSIVIGSLSGGSGSVISPTLLKALLDQGKVAVAIGVTSQDSVIEINNSVKTLKSYEAIAAQTGHPVVLFTQMNTDSSEHEKVNTAIASAIFMLATLASRQNTGLDTADLYNWLNYHRVSTAPVKMVSLELVTGVDFELPEHAQPITTATLAHKGVSTRTSWVSDYQCVGYVPPTAESNISLDKPLHFVVCDGMVGELYKELDKQLQAHERRQRARTYATSVLGTNDTPTAGGLVL